MKIYRYKDRCNIAGAKIKERRTAAGLSQEQLAARLRIAGLSINQKQISRIETDKRLIADFELLIIARVLDTSTECLLLEE